MKKEKPAILVTGASGFIGRHFVNAVSDKFRLFCIARRAQKETGIAHNDDICWIQADITNWANLLSAANYIKKNGGVDYVLHLAGYYDFSMDDNPAYAHTNITGTRNLLKMSQILDVKRFIFSSSLAACNFPYDGRVLTEDSKTDADFPYAKSKSEGEKVVKEYSGTLACSIVRLAAVYSDWCENPPLYMLLKKWLGGTGIISRAIAGKGVSAMPYIHVKDLIRMFVRIIEISDSLPGLTIFIASPKGSVSHADLFKTATKDYYGRETKPLLIPKSMAATFLIFRSFLGKLIGKKPFELPWMSEYIDKKLIADPSETYRALGWKPAPRYHILRRLLFLTQNMKTHSNDWTFRNEALLRRVAVRVSLQIYDIMMEIRNALVDKITKEILHPDNYSHFPNYHKMDKNFLKWCITLNFQMIAVAIRSRDKTIIRNYAQILATRRYMEEFDFPEVKRFITVMKNTIKKELILRPDFQKQKNCVDNYITNTIRFLINEIKETYEIHESHPPDYMSEIKRVEYLASIDAIKPIVRQLEDVCGDLKAF